LARRRTFTQALFQKAEVLQTLAEMLIIRGKLLANGLPRKSRTLEILPATRVGLRDRALLLVGFAGAFRRSELVSLDVQDVEVSAPA
jgi:site-specific recombinase XerC